MASPNVVDKSRVSRSKSIPFTRSSLFRRFGARPLQAAAARPTAQWSKERLRSSLPSAISRPLRITHRRGARIGKASRASRASSTMRLTTRPVATPKSGMRKAFAPWRVTMHVDIDIERAGDIEHDFDMPAAVAYPFIQGPGAANRYQRQQNAG